LLRCDWISSSLVLEGILDAVATGGIARGRVYHCQPTIT
jgi:hypothetical protein